MDRRSGGSRMSHERREGVGGLERLRTVSCLFIIMISIFHTLIRNRVTSLGWIIHSWQNNRIIYDLPLKDVCHSHKIECYVDVQRMQLISFYGNVGVMKLQEDPSS